MESIQNVLALPPANLDLINVSVVVIRQKNDDLFILQIHCVFNSLIASAVRDGTNLYF
jgi:hypothetical protein